MKKLMGHHNIFREEEISEKPSVKIFSQADSEHCLSIRNGSVIIARADPEDPFQLWIKDERFTQIVKDDEGHPSFALVNKPTMLAMKHSIGATRPVQLIEYNPTLLDKSILWSEGDKLGDGYCAIRMITNTRLSVDAFECDKSHGGVRDGSIIVLWEWVYGNNQCWKIVPFSQGCDAEQPPETTNEGLRCATDSLLSNTRICSLRTHCSKYPRYAPLELTPMFASLVSLYESIFKWQNFKCLKDAFTTPAGTDVYLYMARVYISHWLSDLYCTNRDATRTISPSAFNEIYFHELTPSSDEYDTFLTLVNGSIRPTHTQLIEEDSLFIPSFGSTLNWNNDETGTNPFMIDDFTIDHDIFYGILQVMKDSREWKMSKLMTNTLGRPCWLFDWHENTEVCTWFPREGNYDDTDVTLSYIIGVDCTPKFGKCDADNWQFPQSGSIPIGDDTTRFDRVEQLRFSGGYEVRTIEIDTNYQIPDSICQHLVRYMKKNNNEGRSCCALTDPESMIPPVTRFRIVDWTYHARVILIADRDARIDSLRRISLTS